MKKLTNKKSAGFTLIEIVIVMAIAALIILVVIQAISGARRSQRDGARRSEAARISAYIEEMKTNDTVGRYPTLTQVNNQMATYDAALNTKYNIVAFGTACPAPVAADVYQVGYRTQGTNRQGYDLRVCLEATNGYVNINVD